jgi:hypothetical protein
MGKYWDAGRKHLDNEYANIKPINFAKVERLNIEMSKDMDLQSFMGYLTTWSAWNAHRKAHPDLQDPLVPIGEK